MIWYRVNSPKYIGPRTKLDKLIEEVEVDRATAKFVFIGGDRHSKLSGWESYFETRDEAASFIMKTLHGIMVAKEDAADAATDAYLRCKEALRSCGDPCDAIEGAMKDKFFLLSSAAALTPGIALLWGPNNSGYTSDLGKAGVYTRAEITANLSYYDNGNVRPIPMEDALETAMLVLEIEDAEELGG